MTEFEMNRGFLSQVGHSIHQAFLGIGKRSMSVQRRRRFNDLLDLDDHMLRDIGVHRGDVEYLSRQPLSLDAGTELRRISMTRRTAKW